MVGSMNIILAQFVFPLTLVGYLEIFFLVWVDRNKSSMQMYIQVFPWSCFPFSWINDCKMLDYYVDKNMFDFITKLLS